jgi:putative transposase
VTPLNAKWSVVRLPKIGLVKFRDARRLRGTVQNVTVMREANVWHVAFCCAIEHQTPANDLPSVALDRRKRKRGSNRYANGLRRVATLQARAARIRRDWLHRKSTDIARHFGAVGLEDLNVRNMTASAKGTVDNPGRNVRQKAGLNRAILEQGWPGFATLLAYKFDERGGTLTLVPASYSSQECFSCGAIDAQNRKSGL